VARLCLCADAFTRYSVRCSAAGTRDLDWTERYCRGLAVRGAVVVPFAAALAAW
jgi:hypothetical protein